MKIIKKKKKKIIELKGADIRRKLIFTAILKNDVLREDHAHINMTISIGFS